MFSYTCHHGGCTVSFRWHAPGLLPSALAKGCAIWSGCRAPGPVPSASARGCAVSLGTVHLNLFPSASAKGCEHDHHAIWFCCGLYEDYGISALSKEVDIVVEVVSFNFDQ